MLGHRHGRSLSSAVAASPLGEPVTDLPEDPTYAVGRSEHETQRLQRQGQVYAPLTRRLLVDAGIGRGMRVLDVGCGAGDLAPTGRRVHGEGTVAQNRRTKMSYSRLLVYLQPRIAHPAGLPPRQPALMSGWRVAPDSYEDISSSG